MQTASTTFNIFENKRKVKRISKQSLKLTLLDFSNGEANVETACAGSKVYSVCIYVQKEREVKIHCRQLEKMWQEKLKQLELEREEEGQGKPVELGPTHLLALGAPDGGPDDTGVYIIVIDI